MGWQDDETVSAAPWQQDTTVKPAPNPNSWLDDVKKYAPGFIAESARKAAASAMSTWNQGLKNFGTVNLPSSTATAMPIVGPILAGVHSLQNATTGDLQRVIDKVDVPSDNSWWDTAVRGMGAAAALPGVGITGLATKGLNGVLPFLGKQFTQSILPSGMGALGTREGTTLASQITDSPTLQNAAGLAGGILSGGPAAFLTGPKQSPGLAKIREAGAGLNAADYANAEANLRAMQTGGATTATAAEAFGAGSPMVDLARQVRGSVLDNQLRTVTSQRGADLQNLGTTFIQRLENPGGVVNPGDVSNAATDAANGILANLKAQRGQIIDSRQAQIPAINPMYVGDVQSQLRNFANSVDEPGRAAAFHNMADALEGQNGLYTDPKQLSLSISNQAVPFKNPNAPLPANMRTTTALSTQEAIDATRAMIDQYAPGFHASTYHFGNFSNDIIQPFRQSALGGLLDANPVTARQTNPGKLDTLFANAPMDVEENARLLNDPAITGGPTVNPLDIAAALAQRQIGEGAHASSNPGGAISSVMPYSSIEALINAGNPNADTANILSPLRAADAMQSLGPGGGPIIEIPKMNPWTMLIRPARTADMMLSGNLQSGMQQQMAEILAGRGPDAISRIQQLGTFDPNIRRALMLQAAGMPTVTQNSSDPILEGQ